LKLFFGEKYLDNAFLFAILLGVFCMNILFRNLYGNMLSAVGKMKANTIVSALALVLLPLLAAVLVPKYGIMGMATAMSGTLIFTGFLSMIVFLRYVQKLN